MSQNPERARVSLSVDPQSGEGPPSPSETPPFCVVVLGDFSARAHRASTPSAPLRGRRPFAVGSVEDVLERLRPALAFDLEGPGRVELDIRALEDLHPDRLAARVPHLRAFVEAIEPAVAGHGVAGAPRDASSATAPPSPPAPQGGGDDAASGLLDAIVDQTPRAPERRSGPIPDLEPWIRSVVAPHLVQQDTEDQEALRARLWREAGGQVRRVLHAPPVRAYEGLLRSLLLLLSSADPSLGVRVHVLDVTRAELEADLASGLEESALLRALAEPLSGPCAASAPALLVGAWTFGADVRDVALLNRVAMLAHTLGAAWISSAAPDLLGVAAFGDLSDPFPEVEDPPELWTALRETAAATAVGLAAPPFLARMPYGPTTDPCEMEGFDEVVVGGEGPRADAYVWGEPAFMCAAALAASFAERGWNLGVEGPADFAERPFHALDDGEVGAHPVLAPWTPDAAERVRSRGVMPLVTWRGEPRVRVAWIGSVAAPRGPLEAWWSVR
jgi:type VI secretion system protein ImpC